MAHIVFAAPSIARFHLHDRVARALRGRGHRVTVLAPDPVVFDFYSAQGLAAWRLRPTPGCGFAMPLDSFAEQDCLLRGHARPTLTQLTRAAHPLRRSLGGLLRFFEVDPPDLLLLHQERSGMHRLLHFLGREFGCGILWTGDGLVPGTMQADGEGLDADASASRRPGRSYRRVVPQQALLDAILASLLGGALPSPLSRSQIRSPTLRTRLATGAAVLGRRDGYGALGSLRAWREALPPPVRRHPPAAMPPEPFLTVLLQDPAEPRMRLDTAEAWRPARLVRAVAAAAHRLDPELAIVAVLPDGGLPRRQLEAIARIRSVVLHSSSSGVLAASTALAVITVNHPIGIVSLLAGTPLLHTGRALYGLRDVATRTTLDNLPTDLPDALHDNQPTLRARFLTQLLSAGHLWCWPDFPDHNGVNGLVQRIETSIHHEASGVGLQYRAGPVWPLQAESAG